MLITNPDNYLKNFIEFCKIKFNSNLAAVCIYGSYPWGYFDKKKSDYDVILVFKNKTPKGKGLIKEKFPKISLQYFSTTLGILKLVRTGHFVLYITLLKSAGILYHTKEYENLLKELRNPNFFIDEFLDAGGLEIKSNYEKKVLLKRKGWKAIKLALPMIRKRLQLLTYIRYRKLIWELERNLRINKDLLSDEDIHFSLNLIKKVMARSENFDSRDKNIVLRLTNKVDEEIFLMLSE